MTLIGSCSGWRGESRGERVGWEHLMCGTQSSCSILVVQPSQKVDGNERSALKTWMCQLLWQTSYTSRGRSKLSKTCKTLNWQQGARSSTGEHALVRSQLTPFVCNSSACVCVRTLHRVWFALDTCSYFKFMCNKRQNFYSVGKLPYVSVSLVWLCKDEWNLVCACLPNSHRFAHPYQYELEHFSPPDGVLKKPEPQVGAHVNLNLLQMQQIYRWPYLMKFRTAGGGQGWELPENIPCLMICSARCTGPSRKHLVILSPHWMSWWN